jgi:hypothetical protein
MTGKSGRGLGLPCLLEGRKRTMKSMTALETSIRQQLKRHLTGELTLAESTDWFVSASWGVDPQDDPGASHLTYAIELALVERADNVLTAAELAATLRELSASRSLAA